MQSTRAVRIFQNGRQPGSGRSPDGLYFLGGNGDGDREVLREGGIQTIPS